VLVTQKITSTKIFFIYKFLLDACIVVAKKVALFTGLLVLYPVSTYQQWSSKS